MKFYSPNWYVKRRTKNTDAIVEWLYEHSSGYISIAVSLIHDAQEIAVLNGREVLGLEGLNEAYQNGFSSFGTLERSRYDMLRMRSDPPLYAEPV